MSCVKVMTVKMEVEVFCHFNVIVNSNISSLS